MSRLDAIKARLGSISLANGRLIASASPAAHRLLFEDLPKLIAIAEAAQSLMAEDKAKEAVAHYSALFVLEDKVLGLGARE